MKNFKRIIATVLLGLLLGAGYISHVGSVIAIDKRINPPKIITITKIIDGGKYYKSPHSKDLYYYIDNANGIKFEFPACFREALQELFWHPLFKDVDISVLKKFKGIYHTDKINDGIPLEYIVFGRAYLTQHTGLPYTYIEVNTRLEHYLPTAIKSIVWHEFVHILRDKGGHCEGTEMCSLLTKSGLNSSIEELTKGYNEKEKTALIEYIIAMQKLDRQEANKKIPYGMTF